MKRFCLNLMFLLAAAVFVAGCGDSTETSNGDADSYGDTDSSNDSGDAGDSAANDDTAAAKDIVDTAVGAGSFETLVAAVKAADLVDTLKSDGPFTVFAPTDAAFAALPEGTIDNLLKPENKDQLVGILTYHVVPGKVMAADVVNISSAKTVQGSDVMIKVEGDTVMIDGAKVTTTDIECSNGVIHVIDAVILPKS